MIIVIISISIIIALHFLAFLIRRDLFLPGWNFPAWCSGGRGALDCGALDCGAIITITVTVIDIDTVTITITVTVTITIPITITTTSICLNLSKDLEVQALDCRVLIPPETFVCSCSLFKQVLASYLLSSGFLIIFISFIYFC